MKAILISWTTFLACLPIAARESADYAIMPEIIAGGGGRATSTDYTIDPMSRFLLRIEPVPGQPHHSDLVFGPIVAGRSYQVLHSPDLAATPWPPLPGTPPTSDHGDQRTVTDINADLLKKFYRVEIAYP